jgi:hypothetical protein
MVKEAKFFRKQADKAEAAARASCDAEVSEELFTIAHRPQSSGGADQQDKRRNREPKKLPKN